MGLKTVLLWNYLTFKFWFNSQKLVHFQFSELSISRWKLNIGTPELWSLCAMLPVVPDFTVISATESQDSASVRATLLSVSNEI